jgi:hypothetical protein
MDAIFVFRLSSILHLVAEINSAFIFDPLENYQVQFYWVEILLMYYPLVIP